ncbi:MAG: glycosyltransferase family 2 protein, partial [Armatimonadota bacterium]|nr:glycosyltransferase family 2 protein [Armatimonadota bacterium]
MAKKPIVSVVMPAFNPHPVYFRQAVESILNQTFEDWEFVIVEDPSPRQAAEILKDYPDPRIRHFVNPKRTSLVQQRNRALEEACGKLIACQDADDISEPERLAKQVAFMESNPDVAVLGTPLTVIDGDGKVLGYRFYPCEH